MGPLQWGQRMVPVCPGVVSPLTRPTPSAESLFNNFGSTCSCKYYEGSAHGSTLGDRPKSRLSPTFCLACLRVRMDSLFRRQKTPYPDLRAAAESGTAEPSRGVGTP